MSTALVLPKLSEAIERTLVQGDLAQLTAEARLQYYKAVCESVGLNPLTQPFQYITLNGRLTLYARKDCTDQLRQIHNVSVTIAARELTEDCYVVTAQAKLPSGRTDESIGAVSVGNLKGDAKCNAIMKAETKAKRRVTLSICGLGMLDETEIETIPSAKPPDAKVSTQPVIFEEVVPASMPFEQRPQRDSAAPNGGQGSPDVKGESSAPSAELVDQLEMSIEYISSGQATNLHTRFKKVVEQYHPAKALEADDKLYAWLKHRGYVDKDGRGTASKIPAFGWFKVRDEALDYAKTLAPLK